MGAPVSPRTDSSAQESFNSLPQYGFGAELAFDKLVQNNPFLFRVYTPKAQSPFYDSSEPFFVGQKYAQPQEDYFSIPLHEDHGSPSERSASSASSTGSSYADAARHLDWTTRNTSPYISTSFSFAWAVWEAARRYQTNVKHDVHIAVIDARALVGRAVTALSLLREGAPSERHKDHWKWYRVSRPLSSRRLVVLTCCYLVRIRSARCVGFRSDPWQRRPGIHAFIKDHG
jgi:hypothetical protein